jgi:hypothetical protein
MGYSNLKFSHKVFSGCTCSASGYIHLLGINTYLERRVTLLEKSNVLLILININGEKQEMTHFDSFK